MSNNNKIEIHRRGFLARLFSFAAGAAVGATVIETTSEGHAQEVLDSNAPIDLEVLPRNWPSFNDLYYKLKNKPESFTREDATYLSLHMNECRNAWKVLFTYSQLQRNQKALVWTHPLVVDKILYIVTAVDAQKANQKICSRMTNIPMLDGLDEERFGNPFQKTAEKIA